MTRQTNIPGHGENQPNPANARVDQQGDEARPFGEVRRMLDDVLHVLSLHKWAFFVPCCLVASAAFVGSLYYPRLYRATTMFERRNDPVLNDLPLSAGAASFDYFRSTMESDLKSIATMRDVVENLGMTEKFERNEDGTLTDGSIRQRDSLARSLGSMLTIGRNTPNRQTDVIGVTYTGPDPNIGPKLVDEVKRVYIRRTMAWVREYLEGQREYFQEEAQKAAEELRIAQRDNTMLQLENPYANPNDPAVLSTNLSQLEMEHRGLKLRKKEYEAELSSLLQMRATIAPGSEASVDVAGERKSWNALSYRAQQLQAEIGDLDRQIDTLRTSRGMRDAHPDVQKLLSERLRIEGSLDKETPIASASDEEVASNRPFSQAQPIFSSPTQAPSNASSAMVSPELSRLSVQIDSQQSKIDEVDFSLRSNDEAIAQLRSAKENLFENQEDFDAVRSRVANARQRHNQLEGVLMSIEPAINAIKQDRLMQFNEGSPARGSSQPVSPRANVVVLISILAGLAAGIACVVIAEVLDRIYRSSGQVARSLGLPILEAIDEIVTADDRRKSLIRRMVVTPVLVIGLTGVAGLTGSMAYLSIRKPNAYEKLRTVPQSAAKALGVEVSKAPKQKDGDSS